MTNDVPAPDLSEVFDAAKHDLRMTLNAVNIGRIESFNPATQTASVRIAISSVKEVLPDGTRIIQEFPILMECPCVTMFGGGSFVNLPIQKGDSCLVFFNDRQIDGWMSTGQVQPPATARSHDISDAIALVGIRNYQESIARFLADGIRISFAANSEIDLTDNLIESTAALFMHNGNMQVSGNHLVEGNFTVLGTTYGNGGNWTIDSDITQTAGRSIHAGNGATGTFDTVTVVDGIVTGGS